MPLATCGSTWASTSSFPISKLGNLWSWGQGWDVETLRPLKVKSGMFETPYPFGSQSLPFYLTPRHRSYPKPWTLKHQAYINVGWYAQSKKVAETVTKLFAAENWTQSDSEDNTSHEDSPPRGWLQTGDDTDDHLFRGSESARGPV